MQSKRMHSDHLSQDHIEYGRVSSFWTAENTLLVLVDEFRLSGERHPNLNMPVLLREDSSQILILAEVWSFSPFY